jgi:two-component system, NtrC family, response regulator HupR/HoxA
MTDSVQRAACQLSDGSHLEVALTSPANKSDQTTDLEGILTRVKSEIEAARLPKAQVAALRHGLVGKSPSMQALFRMIDKVASTQATVLITGENGTGKELVARAIHAGSPRAGKPFVAANVSAFNDNLLESELFGHRRGAFTGAVVDKRGLFEEADTGTFLLDEVGDMSPALQAKLLRVLQEGTFLAVGGTQTRKVDVRIIAATNRDLAQMVKKGTFREDLYYRLHVVALRTPALRERGSDLDVLVDHFMASLAQRHGRDKRLSPEARAALHAHPWPGNVRELQNEIERVWVLSGDDPMIHPEHLSRNVAQAGQQRSQAQETLPPSGAGAASAEPELDEEPLYRVVERAERQTIERVLGKVGGNRTRAAQALGISRRNLIRKLEQLGLSAADDGAD